MPFCRSDYRIAFMGTPDFSVPTLAALIDAGYNVVACYSQPPRPVGRGYKVSPSPVHAFAESQGIPVYYPTSLRPAEEQEKFKELNLDLAIVAAYGLILPKAILEAPKLGAVNIHASILPRWRGAAPIQRSIMAGDDKTGITIMQMDEGLDTGGMFVKREIEITESTNAKSLHDSLSKIGSELLLEILPEILTGKAKAEPQPEAGVTYAHKLDKNEGLIDWNDDAIVLDRKIRGLNPWPGVWFEYNGERIKVLSAALISNSIDKKLDCHVASAPRNDANHDLVITRRADARRGDPQNKENTNPNIPTPGTIIADDLVIACGNGAIRLESVQKAGKSPMTAKEFLRGNPIPTGTRL